MKKYTVLDNYEGDLKGGQEARQYQDGSIRNEKGYMLERLPGAANITSERGRELVEIKKQKHQEHFRRGLKKAAKVNPNSMDGEELEVYAQHAGEKFLSSENIRGMSEILGRFASLGGYAMESTPVREDGTQGVPSILAELGEEMVRYITQKARERIDD